jgi:hypothetical protein
MVEIDC